MKNRYLAYLNSSADSDNINLNASSDIYNYCQPLPTIPEWQGRKSFSPSTANRSRPKVSESNVRVSKINEASKRHFESVYMAKFPASFHNHVSVSGISGVLKSSHNTNDKQCSGNSKVIRSNLQIKSVSREGGKLSDEGGHVDSCSIPSHLLTPASSTNKLEGKMHDDTKQHSLDYDLVLFVFNPILVYIYTGPMAELSYRRKAHCS